MESTKLNQSNERTLYLAMPGVPEWQERFWEEVIVAELGLADRTEMVFQANAKWGGEFPEDIMGRLSPDQIIEEQRQHTERRLRGEWTPKPYALVYGDFEPRRRLSGGNYEHWQLRTWREGFNEADLRFLPLMRQGIQKVLPDIPYTLYNAPMMQIGRWWNDDKAVHTMLSYLPIASLTDATWLGLYPSSNPAHNDLSDPRNGEGHASRVITGYKLKATMGKPVLAGLFFRHFQDNAAYQSRTLDLLDATGVTGIIGWVKAGERIRGEVDAQASRTMLDEYKRQWSASAEDIHAWLDRHTAPAAQRVLPVGGMPR